MNEEEFLAICKALSHPLRLRIVKLLEKSTLRKRDLTRLLGLNRADTPKLEHHLDRLVKAGLVGVYKSDRATYVYLLKKVDLRVENIPPPTFSPPTRDLDLNEWFLAVREQVKSGRLPKEVVLENIRFLKKVLTRKALL